MGLIEKIARKASEVLLAGGLAMALATSSVRGQTAQEYEEMASNYDKLAKDAKEAAEAEMSAMMIQYPTMAPGDARNMAFVASTVRGAPAAQKEIEFRKKAEEMRDKARQIRASQYDRQQQTVERRTQILNRMSYFDLVYDKDLGRGVIVLCKEMVDKNGDGVTDVEDNREVRDPKNVWTNGEEFIVYVGFDKKISAGKLRYSLVDAEGNEMEQSGRTIADGYGVNPKYSVDSLKSGEYTVKIFSTIDNDGKNDRLVKEKKFQIVKNK